MKKLLLVLIPAVLSAGLLTVFAEEKKVRKPLPSAEEIAKLPKDGGEEFNRLVFETSPYLRQHARNPVDWYPWGKEAFELAKKTDRPVFLSVGYSSCHWCHVMEHESFEDPVTAAIMNKRYVNVKVDREERPDIDEIYMNATQAMVQRGGWPNSVWLTPDRKPWYCGTYFPPKDMPGRLSFTNVMNQLDGFWTDQREDVEAQAEELSAVVARMSYGNARSSGAPLNRGTVEQTMDDIANEFDALNGGFGGAPKFPPHGALRLLTYEVRSQARGDWMNMLTTTLDKMALGGMYDQVGGGFHRYATDATWFLPHFEKMLYDNAQLGRAYSLAYDITSNENYRVVAEGIFDWALREMRDPAGGFYSAYDADSEGEEGIFYLWKWQEVEDILGKEDADLYRSTYNFTEQGTYYEEATRVRTGHNIPYLKSFVADKETRARLDAMNLKLRKVRDKRVWPGLDDKVLTSWNGLMIGALAKGGELLDKPEYTKAAAEAADFILGTMKTDDGRLLHTYSQGTPKLNAYLDDYTFLMNGLLDLYEATGDDKWQNEVIRLVGVLNKHYKDEKGGAYFYTSSDHENLIARSKDPIDKAVPSSNAMAALVFMRLGESLGNDGYLKKGKGIVELFDTVITRIPRASSTMMLALSKHIDATSAAGLAGGVAGAPGAGVAAPPGAVQAALELDALVEKKSVKLAVKLDNKELEAGDPIVITGTFLMKEHWHIQTNKPQDPDTTIATVFELADDTVCEEGFAAWPKTKDFKIGPIVAPGFEGSAEVKLLAKIKGDLKPGKHTLKLKAGWQACDDEGLCIFPEEAIIEIPITVK